MDTHEGGAQDVLGIGRASSAHVEAGARRGETASGVMAAAAST
ncbi:hypothetical protein WME89_44995 [Sorangium sp. So ce321]